MVRPALARLSLVALLAASLAAGTKVDGKIAATRWNGSSELVASLRRQLMTNNYDYMTSSESEEFPALREREAPRAEDHTEITDAPNLLPFVNDIYLRATSSNPLSITPSPSPLASLLPNQVLDSGLEYSGSDSRDPDKNDLLYYMDERLLNRRKEPDPVKIEANHSMDATPAVKYKVLKLKGSGGTRRSGGGRQIIAEESPAGVALINLGDEPFPEFRLPRPRTLLSAETSVQDTDFELAVPSDSEGEPVTRPP